MDPRRAGHGQLDVGLVARQSAVVRAWAVNPFKLLVPRSRGPSVWAYASSFGGGLVAGDEVRLRVDIGSGAACFLGTQASTKVYRNPEARPCGHELRARVREGAVLIVAPDPVQCFAQARYRQDQTFELAEDAGLVLVDWLTSGRAARGERWAFQHYQSRNEVRLGKNLIFLDTLRLDPRDGPVGDPYRAGRFDCLATVAVIGQPWASNIEAILRDASSQPVGRRTALTLSASPLQNGVVLRIAGEQVEAVAHHIVRTLSFVRARLRDDPWARKY